MKEKKENEFKKRKERDCENKYRNINESARHNPNDRRAFFNYENTNRTVEQKRRKVFLNNTNVLETISFHDEFQQFSKENETSTRNKEQANKKYRNSLECHSRTEKEYFNNENKETYNRKFKPYNSNLNMVDIYRMQKNMEYNLDYGKIKQNSQELEKSAAAENEPTFICEKTTQSDSFMTPPLQSSVHDQSLLYDDENMCDFSLRRNNEYREKNPYGFSTSDYYIYNIKPVKNTTYQDAKLLNDLWNTYIDELTETLSSDILIPSFICELELNGAFLEIHKSYCATYVGIKGIVLLETVNAFKMITPQSKIVTILKNKTVFTLSIKTKTYFLNGVHLIRDPALKSAKKFKYFKKK